MKAKFIYENLNFERGLNPKTSMGIGLGPYADQIMEINRIIKPLGFTMIQDHELEDDSDIKDIMYWKNLENGDLINLFYYEPIEDLKEYAYIGDGDNDWEYSKFLDKIKYYENERYRLTENISNLSS